MPQCLKCHLSFSVDSKDKKILDRLDVSEPQLCFEHSLQHRMLFRNERHLYRRNCGLCGKSILSVYSQHSPATVYCRPCWYSDNWDALQYGRDYDAKRPFFEQIGELIRQVPHFNLWQVGRNENCEYTNAIINSKDCYLTFSCLEGVGCIYCEQVGFCRDCVDCFLIDNSELLYDCVITRDSYASAFLTRCEKCSSCYLGRHLFDCQDCFGSVNLRHKRFYWYNEPLVEEEYRRRLTEALRNRESFDIHRRRFAEHQKQFPLEYARNRASENITGQEINKCRNIRRCIKDCYRTNHTEVLENSYEVSFAVHVTNARFSFITEESSFLDYCYSCYTSTQLFGCVGLRGKKFCILNKQYEEKSYQTLRAQIIAAMKTNDEWGKFFPPQYSLQAYNDTIAYRHFPLTKEQVSIFGMRWEDDQGGIRDKETLSVERVPTAISETSASITKEILRCVSCGLNYRIQLKELQVLQSVRLSVPTECHECRFRKRFYDRTYIARLYERQCNCDHAHDFHKAQRCPNRFFTAYSQDRSEKIFCSPCFQEEIF